MLNKDNRKPKHPKKEIDLKLKAKKKREELDKWIEEENNLRKGI